MPTKFNTYLILFLCFLTFMLNSQNKQIEHSLFFSHASSELTGNHKREIDSLRTIFIKDSTKIEIKGYTNNLGYRKYNLKLSRKRVASVKSAFVNDTNITAIGYGELENSFSKSRRVDVIISVFEKKDVEENIPIFKEKTVKDEDLLNIIEPIKVGDTYALKGVLFKGGQDAFLRESFPQLKKLFSFMKSTNLKIKLLGHVCCEIKNQAGENQYFKKGSSSSNLSIKRAEAVHDYLIRKGIDRNRISYIGLGNSFPSGKGDKFDRRVEMEIMSID